LVFLDLDRVFLRLIECAYAQNSGKGVRCLPGLKKTVQEKERLPVTPEMFPEEIYGEV